MCGIIGYSGNGRKNALDVLLSGLGTLEYRGYDSAGVALFTNGKIKTVKSKGRLPALVEKANATENSDLRLSVCGIGHTRWATHGAPSDTNAHPHTTENLALVHNGIIENYREIEDMLGEAGYEFISETDTEAAAKLVDLYYKRMKNPVRALFAACGKLRGSYAFAVLFADRPGYIYAIRKDSPLVISVADVANGSESLVASDVTAVIGHNDEYIRLDEGIVAVLSSDGAQFLCADGTLSEQKREKVNWSIEQAQKGGYPHFMLKEIYEEPAALEKTVGEYLRDGLPYFSCEAADKINTVDAESVGRIHIVACGTAMHAGLLGKAVIEKLARLPVDVSVASEFRYGEPILGKNDLVLLLSQSGETADTIAALRYAKAAGVKTLSVVNVIGSTVAREADGVIYTRAGPEIAVASTKAYSVQAAVLYLLAVKLAAARGKITDNEARKLCATLRDKVPSEVGATLKLSDKIREISAKYNCSEHLFYIGRGADCALCTEGSLKLKEISYIHSEAYPAGELKHGTISLVTEGVPVVALMTVSALAEKMISGIREVRSRGASVYAIVSREIADNFAVPCDNMTVLTVDSELFAPFSAATALQLFAYHAAAGKGLDVDKPRNLAKSVTVE